ncbi:MAG: response regulator transcription factor [Bacteroidetes bacterium]|nr:response regulator transcription factor [Bacteroidota bacterium]
MASNKKILVIDDDKKLCGLLQDYLSKFDYKVITSTNPENGLDLVAKESPDLVILDVMMPGKDGFEVCKEIRKESSVPVIMLTARGEVTDRIVGLELGADDYLPKPFEPRELVARIQTILRRSTAPVTKEKVEFGELVVDFQRQTAELNGVDLDLTTAEFEILSLFIKKSGKVLNRDNILENLKGIEWDVFNRSIDVLISRLRQKLKDDPKNPRFIKTIWGSGYKFIGDE